jgi:hypothetical protein
MFLLEEKLTALWRTCMDVCKALERTTGQNELGELSTGRDFLNWNEHMEATNLQDLVNADDFKTPKKVRIISFMTKDEEDDHVEVAEIGTLTPLNVDELNLTPLEGSKRTPGNVALRRIVMEWDGLAEKFGALKNRFLMHEALTGATKDDVTAHVVECDHFMNKLGNKARLLAARIGMDGRADQAESSVWESINVLQDEVDHEKEEARLLGKV